MDIDLQKELKMVILSEIRKPLKQQKEIKHVDWSVVVQTESINMIQN